jgi:hypothetical protein
MVESDTTRGTGMVAEVGEEEEGPFWDWAFADRNDHWEFLVPKRGAPALIAAKHGVDAKTAEALFFDVFFLEFSNFLEQCLEDVVSSPIDVSGAFPLVKLPFWDRLSQSGQNADRSPSCRGLEEAGGSAIGGPSSSSCQATLMNVRPLP